MVNPTTVNIGLIVPLTGADVDTWGEDDVNPNMSAVDGLFAGIQTISVTGGNTTLTSPAGFTPTPGGGPTQAQNRVLRFTGTLTSDAVIFLPVPGVYVVDNQTTGNFVLFFRGVTATEVIATPQGEQLEIYNDGANVRFINLARTGAMEMWAGIVSIPLWVADCTIRPYLLCDGSVYNISDFPALGNRLLGKFGGNGITTFGVPDMQGRVPLAYDGTAARITTAGCGIDGQNIGSAGGTQSITMAQTDLPNVQLVVTGTVVSTSNATNIVTGTIQSPFLTTTTASGQYTLITVGTGGSARQTSSTANTGGSVSLNTASMNGGVAQTNMRNVQPSIVTGIWVIKT